MLALNINLYFWFSRMMQPTLLCGYFCCACATKMSAKQESYCTEYCIWSMYTEHTFIALGRSARELSIIARVSTDNVSFTPFTGKTLLAPTVSTQFIHRLPDGKRGLYFLYKTWEMETETERTHVNGMFSIILRIHWCFRIKANHFK